MKLVPYERHDADVKDWDPTALEVFSFVRGQVAAATPDHEVEHIGSTSVPGLPGKGIVDAMVLVVDDADAARVAEQLTAAGWEHARGSTSWRPFLLAGVEQDGNRTQVHVHVIGADSDEATAQRGLAAALREDPDLREEYASLKRGVVAEGTRDPAQYSMKKIDWVLATLERLGLPPLPDPGEPPPPPSPRSSP
ncbi:MAG TPA: GrpB family protein [Segeticoccus sp.]|nr:GrpB family protein [Segeticoccus sp.]